LFANRTYFLPHLFARMAARMPPKAPPMPYIPTIVPHTPDINREQDRGKSKTTQKHKSEKNSGNSSKKMKR